MQTKNMSAEELAEVFQFNKDTSLSESIILSALSINKETEYLPVKEYRENAFPELWKHQFHRGQNWLAQFRSELNQGTGRLAYRVFESPEGKGFRYRLKHSGISRSDRTVIDNLKSLIKTIEEGNSILDDDNDEVYQRKISWVRPKKSKEGKVAKKKKAENQSSAYPRDPRIAKQALIGYDFTCQIDNEHETFINPKNGKNFVEAHHLVPMEFQDKFEYSLDVEDNIVALCPNCHREIHYGGDENIVKMIDLLINDDRLSLLEGRGLTIAKKKLIEYYLD